MRIKKKNIFGFTLVETVVGVALFLIVALSIYQSFISIYQFSKNIRVRVLAANLANEQIEIIRNIPYADIGIVSGIPLGVIPNVQTLTRGGITYTVTSTIRNIDDAFDGTLGGTPNDTRPADYKKIIINVSCTTCANFTPINFTSSVAPKNLEMASSNGALFVKVFDANGNPVQGATVHIERASPIIIVNDVTDSGGNYQLIDVPPGAEVYEVTVSKTGYSSDRTYADGDVAIGSSIPAKYNATITAGNVTQVSFAIDRTSTIAVKTVTDTCVPKSAVNFSLSGSKIIATAPDVLKYSGSFATDGSGQKNLNNIEWDTYNFAFNDSVYDLVGSNPLNPIVLGPNATQNLQLIVAPKNGRGLLVTVTDGTSGLPISGASVTLTKGSDVKTLITGRGFLRQSDWSLGDGQADIGDLQKFFSSDGNIEYSAFPSELRLKETAGQYQTSGSLESSTFDTGSASNFQEISWQPESQPPDTGADSVSFQIATSSDKTIAVWNFKGPDGTESSYYTLSNRNISPANNGARYARYKIYLKTEDTAFTPNVSNIAFTFTSDCTPSGQVFFDALDNDTYTLNVSKGGYAVLNDTIDINSNYKDYSAKLNAL